MMLKHKFYKSSPRTVLLMLAASLLAAGLSSCSQADSQSDFEPITPPPLEIPPVDPPPVPENGTDVPSSTTPDFYSPLPTEPAAGSATSSPYGAFGVTPAAPVPSSPNSTIPFSTGQPVIPQPSSGIQVTPQSPIQAAPAAPVPTAPVPTAPIPTAPVPTVPSAVPNVAPPLSNATPGTPNGVNSGMYMPPPASTF